MLTAFEPRSGKAGGRRFERENGLGLHENQVVCRPQQPLQPIGQRRSSDPPERPVD